MELLDYGNEAAKQLKTLLSNVLLVVNDIVLIYDVCAFIALLSGCYVLEIRFIVFVHRFDQFDRRYSQRRVWCRFMRQILLCISNSKD